MTKNSDCLFEAGAARITINPSGPIWLGGFDSRTKPSGGILNDLYARALALRDAGGETSLIISVDQTSVSSESFHVLATELCAHFGLKRERLTVVFSHSHCSPVPDLETARFYPLTEDGLREVETYRLLLHERIREVADHALKALAPARLAFGQSVAGFGVNRRRVRPGCRHLPGPVDPDVPVLRVTGEDGIIKAVVFGYACHTTTLAFDTISSDYAGFAAEALEQTCPGAVALFVMGCGADINPLPRFQVELARSYGRTLAAAVQEVIARKDLPELRQLPAAARTEIRLAFAAPAAEPPSGDCVYPIQVWNFGPDLLWIILTSEVCVDYSLRFKAAYGWESTWVSAYANERVAYIPSRRVLEEGGYEGVDSNLSLGLPGPFASGIEETIAAAVADLVRETQNKPVMVKTGGSR